MRLEQDYDVTPDVLVGLLTDLAFLAARSERFGGLGAPTVERTPTAVVVTSGRQLPLEHVPSTFRRFVGDGRVVQTDTWSDGRGIWTVDTGPAPIRLSGVHELAPLGSGCRYAVTADVRVSVPVLAGRLTRLVETHLSDLIRAEQAFAAEWLTA